MITTSSCFLKGKSIYTSAQILGSFKIAPHQVRFILRHDQVQFGLAVALKHFLSSYKPIRSFNINSINFVRDVKKKHKNAPTKVFLDILTSPSDWNLKFDLDEMLVVVVFLTISTLRQDILYFRGHLLGERTEWTHVIFFE